MLGTYIYVESSEDFDQKKAKISWSHFPRDQSAEKLFLRTIQIYIVVSNPPRRWTMHVEYNSKGTAKSKKRRKGLNTYIIEVERFLNRQVSKIKNTKFLHGRCHTHLILLPKTLFLQ